MVFEFAVTTDSSAEGKRCVYARKSHQHGHTIQIASYFFHDFLETFSEKEWILTTLNCKCNYLAAYSLLPAECVTFIQIENGPS